MATAPGITEKYIEETLAHEQTSLWGDAWRRLRRNRLALVSTVFLTLLTLVAIIAQFWTPYSYFTQGLGPIYQGPTAQHWLGLDQSGRDILSRLMLGAQVSLKVGIGTQMAFLFEAFLSFLGLGVPPPTPSWGAMAADGFHAIRISPHIVLAPAIALSLTLMAFNFLGDGLRDALDPRQKR